MLTFNVQLVGVERLKQLIRMAPSTMTTDTTEAAKDLSDKIWTIVTTPPPLSSGNRPPTPYWVRGEGRVVGKNGLIDRPSYQLSGNTAHVRTTVSPDAVRSQSDVPYAIYAIGKQQSRAMRDKGWRNIDKVSQEQYSLYMGKQSTLVGKIKNSLNRLFSS